MKRTNLKKLNDAYADKFGFSMPEKSVLSFDFGLSQKIISDISTSKNEPPWMREFRQKSLQVFRKMKETRYAEENEWREFDEIY